MVVACQTPQSRLLMRSLTWSKDMTWTKRSRLSTRCLDLPVKNRPAFSIKRFRAKKISTGKLVTVGKVYKWLSKERRSRLASCNRNENIRALADFIERRRKSNNITSAKFPCNRLKSPSNKSVDKSGNEQIQLKPSYE